jgi:hypothetical protein
MIQASLAGGSGTQATPKGFGTRYGNQPAIGSAITLVKCRLGHSRIANAERYPDVIGRQEHAIGARL